MIEQACPLESVFEFRNILLLYKPLFNEQGDYHYVRLILMHGDNFAVNSLVNRMSCFSTALNANCQKLGSAEYIEHGTF